MRPHATCSKQLTAWLSTESTSVVRKRFVSAYVSLNLVLFIYVKKETNYSATKLILWILIMEPLQYTIRWYSFFFTIFITVFLGFVSKNIRSESSLSWAMLPLILLVNEKLGVDDSGNPKMRSYLFLIKFKKQTHKTLAFFQLQI